ncbi:hypothetical protein P7266_1339 [Lactococcus cremoris]|nr:hypothetical protein P7266_1339 [Lactococcus cremoris]
MTGFSSLQPLETNHGTNHIFRRFEHRIKIHLNNFQVNLYFQNQYEKQDWK